MATIDSSRLTLEAIRLQNGYARAIDTCDWDLFRTLFTPDIVAQYIDRLYYESMDAWLEFFIPFHDDCLWTQHIMTNHFAAVDEHGPWASCYGDVQWIMKDQPDAINRSVVMFRDRLVEHDGNWVIARRSLEHLSNRPEAPIPEGTTFPNSVRSLADNPIGKLSGRW
jgi:hypothetical protein